MSAATVVWFRQDLRVSDNLALSFAAERGGPVIPVYVWAPDEEDGWAPGAASRVWLHGALVDLQARLGALGSRLVIRTGRTLTVLCEVAEECGADQVVWNRRYEPAAVACATTVKAALQEAGIGARSFNPNLLTDPATVRNKAGHPFRVFTPFWNHVLTLPVRPPRPTPAHLVAPANWPRSESPESLGLRPAVAWDAGIHATWDTTGDAALGVLERFADESLDNYARGRDRPDEVGTSRLSPYLHFGQVSPATVWARLHPLPGQEPYLRQVVWRDFAHHLLYHFPATTDAPLNDSFTRFPWDDGAPATLGAWQRGETGYPLVDAGMRELWHTGWMHNRVRMNVASFLVKHLLLHWRHGAAWFWDTLVDADLANNTMGWQWVAGCGADAAPYFRIFNPTVQGQRFDPAGLYVRRWVPELARLDAKYIHAPAAAPQAALDAAGIVLGRDYPHPIVEHKAARARALAALEQMKRTAPD